MVVGRTGELAALKALLDGARAGRSGALLIEGDAGVGKTALLDAAAEIAVGFTHLRTCGVESEATLDHAALLQVLSPLRETMRQIPDRPAAAVAAALGWAAGGEIAGDRFLVGAGTLALLAQEAAERRPVLVVVDDLQWVDRESAQALLFAARRLGADAVLVLLAARSGVELTVPVDGVDRLTLGGLTAADAQQLLPDVGRGVADELAAATGGNPLAMLETAGRLTAAQRVGTAPLPEPLPVGARLERDYGRLLAGLTADAWRAVLLLAASLSDAEAPVVNALQAAGADAETALDEAQLHGVLAVGSGRLTFRHPLLRSAAWRTATPAQRRDAHRALAESLPRDSAERALQLAAATAGPDDRLADELAAVAGRMRARRGLAAASAALERAASLTTDPDRASDRLVEAVDDAFLAGDTDRTSELGRRALAGDLPAVARSRVLHTLGLVEEYGGAMTRAADLQQEAATSGNGVLRVRALAALVSTRYRLNDPAGMRAAAERLAAVADTADPEQRMLSIYSLGAAQTYAGDLAAGRALIMQARDLLETEPALRDDPRYLLPALMVALWTGDPTTVLPYVDRRLATARLHGAIGVLVPALALISFGMMELGDHAQAYAVAGEAVELGEGIGYRSDLAAAHLALAVGHASRGRHQDAADSCAAARRLVERAGLADIAGFVTENEAFCAGCRGEPAQVVALLEPRVVASGRGWRGDVLPVAPELVQAYLSLSRADEATDLAHQYAAANTPPAGPVVEAYVARTLASVEPDLETACAHFDAALAALAAWPDPFEQARTLLMYGARLRRAGQRIAARTQLRAARDTFAVADLTLWSERAADELAATGETARSRRPMTDEPLTSQETRVALLVARGLTNKEVAAALFLSPKTVEHHLGNVYRKRGLRSRTELTRAFATSLDRAEPDL